MKQIMLVEALAECSCCASQVCGCDNINDNINQATNSEIYYLNQQQRQPVPDDPDVGIVPQCDINFTLCGEDGGQAD
jgi:hypothetical protein